MFEELGDSPSSLSYEEGQKPTEDESELRELFEERRGTARESEIEREGWELICS